MTDLDHFGFDALVSAFDAVIDRINAVDARFILLETRHADLQAKLNAVSERLVRVERLLDDREH